MRKLFVAMLAVFAACLLGCTKTSTVYNDPYDPQAAITYAYQYAETRNPEYANLESNCTNYISQILVAGGKKMDEPIAPKKDVRITYHNKKDRWFSTYIETNPVRWREFSVSTSFCRTESFVEYWTKTRGMTLTDYVNSIDGLLKLYDRAEAGDIILLYDADGKIVHLCLLTVRENKTLLISANTIDYRDHNILDISAEVYPRIGLLEIE